MLLSAVLLMALDGVRRGAPSEGRRDFSGASAFARHLATRLSYLYDRRRVHRDVKPANILKVEGPWRLSDSTANNDARSGSARLMFAELASGDGLGYALMTGALQNMRDAYRMSPQKAVARL